MADANEPAGTPGSVQPPPAPGIGAPDGLSPESVERAIARQRLRRRVSFVGCGCLIVLAVLGIAFLVVIYQGAQNLAADFADPEARAQKVLETLGADALPEGYHAVMAVDVPLPFDMVVLSDEPWILDEQAPGQGGALPVFNGVPGSKLFYFMHIKAEDRSGNDPFEREYRSEQKLGQGDLDIHGRRVAWEAHRGQSLRPQGDAEGIFVRLRLECEDRETRRAIWFHQRKSTEGTANDQDVSGTPADPEALAEFLSHFRVCGPDTDTANEATPSPP